MLIKAIMFMAAFASADLGAAQEPPQATDETEIVVTGTAPGHRQLRDFVDALTQAPVGGQLSRFEWSVCPMAFGLPEAQNQAVAQRMRAVAKAANVPLGGSDCHPNVLVMVARDKPAFLAELLRDHPYLFHDMSKGRIRRLLKERGPATSWQVKGALLDADGIEIPMVKLDQNSPPVLYNQTMRSPSRMTAAVREHFAAAVLVVEIGALEGLTATQLADYAAMRTLARTDPDHLPDTAPPTILTMLDAPMGAPVPITLTRWDLGFLRGLYTSDDVLYAASRRSQMRGILEKDLEAKDPEQD